MMMTCPDMQQIYAANDATWPAARSLMVGPWAVREGLGGGKRVGSASTDNVPSADDILQMEAAHADLGQPPLVMIKAGQAELDQILADRGYGIVDPVNIYAIPVAALADQKPPRVSMFTVWEPLQIQLDIWTAQGIGPARQAVMQRAICPKTSILARWNDSPAGTGYVGLYEGIAMIHAIEILRDQQRQGVGTWMMRAASRWAQAQGAQHLALICRQSNVAANALYVRLGMQLCGQYHYRQKET
jgi:ribosomal protein S18 acetylase RimI-like enzyme